MEVFLNHLHYCIPEFTYGYVLFILLINILLLFTNTVKKEKETIRILSFLPIFNWIVLLFILIIVVDEKIMN